MKINAIKQTITISFADLSAIQKQLDIIQRLAQGLHDIEPAIPLTTSYMEPVAAIRETLSLTNGAVKLETSR